MTSPLSSRRSCGFTLIELLIVIAVVALLFSVAAIYLPTARISARETSAIEALIAINDAQSAYKELCGNGRYAASLTALGVPMQTTGEAFLSPDLTGADIVVKSGYRFVMTGTTGEAGEARKGCNDTDTVQSYAVTADPVQPGTSGTRFFATNASRAIYVHTESFAGSMPETGPPAVGTELR